MDEKIMKFAERVQAEKLIFYMETSRQTGFQHDRDHVLALHGKSGIETHVRPGKKYTKVDVGHSGTYMVVNNTGEIFGVKAYGVIHKGHRYGTLDTIDEWNWGPYTAIKRPQPPPPRNLTMAEAVGTVIDDGSY